jgi:transcriptional regulator with XRE-family HTH domain
MTSNTLSIVTGPHVRFVLERERLGLTARQVADMTGVPLSRQLAMESGAAAFPVKYLDRAHALGVDVGRVMGLDDDVARADSGRLVHWERVPLAA